MQTIKLDMAEIVAERLRYREALELIAKRGHGMECLIAKAAMGAAGGTPLPDEWSESGWPKCRVCGEEWTEVCSDGMCEGCADESEARAAAELKGDAVRDEA